MATPTAAGAQPDSGAQAGAPADAQAGSPPEPEPLAARLTALEQRVALLEARLATTTSAEHSEPS